MPACLIRLLRCMSGYLIAVLIASQIALAFVYLADVSSVRQVAKNQLLQVMGFACVITLLYAALPAACFIAYGELKRVRSPIYHAVTGALTAIAALLIASDFQSITWGNGAIPIGSMAGGLAGGLAYAAFSAVNAGRPVILPKRRKRTRSMPLE